ncbi:MAG: nitrogenase component 1 [Clostridia bacterium]
MEKRMRNPIDELDEKMRKDRELSGMERCPLSSAAKAIASIDGAVMLVIGTEECSYYTQSGITRRGRGDSCFSVVMDKHDVTFGSAEKVALAIEELMEISTPKNLFIITTCVPEIIGEDYQSIVQETQEKYKLPVHLLSTNHYSGKDGEYGFELVEKAIGYPLPRNKGKGGKKGGPMMGKRGDMNEEEMMKMMRQKMGGHMSEDEMREKMQSRMGGGKHR